jgi:hypothetical protein
MPDAFISHASEDKAGFVRPLADGLITRGLSIWYDEYSLRLGDSLTQCINNGLASSRYAVLVLSPAFFQKQWTTHEMNGITQNQVAGICRILPIWHGVSAEEVRRFAAPLADLVAVDSSKGIEHVIEKIVEGIRGHDHERNRVAESALPAPLRSNVHVAWADQQFFSEGLPCFRCGRWSVVGSQCRNCGAVTDEF